MLQVAEMGWKRVFITANNCLPKASKEVLLTGPKMQVQISSHSGDYGLGEGQLYSLPLIVISE